MNGPLSKLKVLDFSTLLPGPFATQILADMGAEVLRVESPTRPDLLKSVPPLVNDLSAAHLTINRNKRSIAIDLKHPDAKEIIFKLVKEYDIVVEQFRPGVMKKLGLDYPSLQSFNPEVIFCSITGYGQTGPNKDKAGHDINYMALSGLASYGGKQSSGPALCATQIADIAGGSHQAVMSILAAVIARQSSGQGQHLDVSICDAAFALNAIYGASALASNEDPAYENRLLNGGSFYDYYQTSDKRYLSVGALEPKFAQQFFSAIERPEWLSRLQQNSKEQLNLKQDLARIIAKNSLAHWKNVFSDFDACVEPVLTLNESATSPQFKQRNMVVSVALSENATEEQIDQIAQPVKFSDNRLNFTAGKATGADTFTVLQQLNYSEAQIRQLLKEKTVAANSIPFTKGSQ